MNGAVKRKWLVALRSGRYRQGKKALSHAGRYCCLGVLCDLAVKEGVTAKKGDAFGGFKAMPPNEVLDWAGLPLSGSPINDLADMNDRGVPFKDIAKKIASDL